MASYQSPAVCGVGLALPQREKTDTLPFVAYKCIARPLLRLPGYSGVVLALVLLTVNSPPGAAKDLPTLRQKAELRDVDAQYTLGLGYYLGKGVAQDYSQAVTWFRKAAKQGYAPAQFNLGVMYNKGRGVAQDYPQALTWFRKAAEQGDAEVQFNLGGDAQKRNKLPRHPK